MGRVEGLVRARWVRLALSGLACEAENFRSKGLGSTGPGFRVLGLGPAFKSFGTVDGRTLVPQRFRTNTNYHVE